MDRTAIAPRTGAERAQQVDFGEELQRIAGAHGAGFHKILTGIAGKTCAHENIKDIVDMRLGLRAGDAQMICERAREVGVTAVVILIAREQIMGIGIAAGADHIMD